MSTPSSISECLQALGIKEFPSECESLADEFKCIKKIFFERARKEHPDKGGSAAAFRRTRAVFDFLRKIYEENRLPSFLDQGSTGPTTSFEEFYRDFDDGGAVPSYEYYEHAAEEELPGYKVEPAKSARSQCVKVSGGD